VNQISLLFHHPHRPSSAIARSHLSRVHAGLRVLITDVVLCEDGHAQERSMTQDILEMVRPNDLWIKDRNFCTTGFLFGIASRGGFFVTRQHGSTLRCENQKRERLCSFGRSIAVNRAVSRCQSG
jgi:hypothetical protein